jgi:cardiolipin synthase
MNKGKTFSPLEVRRRRNLSKAPDAKTVKIRTEHNGLSSFKTLFALFLIFLQLGIIISLNFLFVIAARWYLIFLAVVSIITAITVLSSHRSGQAKAVWILFILVFFSFGFIVYFLSNDKFMYHRQRKRHKRIYSRSNMSVRRTCVPQESSKLYLTSKYLYNAGGFATYTNTKLKYFPSGASMFDDVLDHLKDAKQYIFIEYFAIADGVLLKRIWDILEQKLKEGVDVRIIFDDMGSRVLSLKTRKKMRAAGVKLKVFNRLLSRFTFALNYRDHRKIIVIDGKVAYTGGCNMADEYINEKRMHGYWKDTGLRIEGEAVDSMTLIFLRQWEFVLNKQEEYSKYIDRYEELPSDSFVLPYASGPEFEQSICKAVFEEVMSSARQKLYIMTPYFIPDESITQHLINLALAGVDVRIVLPSIPDKYYVYLVSKDNAERLTKYGVKIYYMEETFVHSKLMLNEGCAVIGSVNVDMRSFYQQFENGIVTDDSQTLADIEKDFNNVFADSKCVTKPQHNGLLKSIAIAVLRFVSPLM